MSAVLTLPAEQFRIITSGKELLASMNSKTVKELGLVDKQTLNVVKRPSSHQVDVAPKAESPEANSPNFFLSLFFLSFFFLSFIFSVFHTATSPLGRNGKAPVLYHFPGLLRAFVSTLEPE